MSLKCNFNFLVLFFLHNLDLYGLDFMVMVALSFLVALWLWFSFYGFYGNYIVFMVVFALYFLWFLCGFGLQYGFCFRSLNMVAISVMVAKNFQFFLTSQFPLTLKCLVANFHTYGSAILALFF